MRSFITSQFNYCPLIWIFHSRMLNNRIKRIHKRALRLVYKDYCYTFNEILEKDGSFSIHHRNLQKLATETYKIENNLLPKLMPDIFPQYDPVYDFRKKKKKNIFQQ